VCFVICFLALQAWVLKVDSVSYTKTRICGGNSLFCTTFSVALKSMESYVHIASYNMKHIADVNSRGSIGAFYIHRCQLLSWLQLRLRAQTLQHHDFLHVPKQRTSSYFRLTLASPKNPPESRLHLSVAVVDSLWRAGPRRRRP
jgi:hypothetical protein